MFEKGNHINYTAEDIQQYLSGKLTPLQMNAMEKAALDDPFLAEAIEGYESMQHEDWKKQLASLKEGFSPQTNTAKVIALPRRTNWFKYAAAVLLIGGTATISYWLINKKEDQQQIAQAVKTTSTSDSIQTAATNREVISDSQTANATAATKSVENNITAIDKNADAVTEKIKPDSNFIYKPAVQPPVEFAKANGRKIMDDVVVNQQTASAANAANPSSTLNAVNVKEAYNKPVTRQEELKKSEVVEMRDKASSKDELQLNRNFIAQVVGPDNTPLPFANISIKSENFGTYADVQGNFRLVSPDSVLTVEIRSAGYQPKSYTLKSSDVAQNKIVLAEDNLAFQQKTIVSGNTAARSAISRKATLLKDSVINVEPADGWDNYNTYVDNNIEIPDDILNKNIHGQVELSFDVKSNGSISNIKVDKSLCNNCDEVAKRLIEQGPQWKIKKGRKGRGKITVQF